MSKTISVVLYPRLNKNKKHPIKIRITENRVSKYFTLPIEVDKRYWVKTKNRISKSHPNFEEYNYIIETKLKEFENLLQISGRVITNELNVFDELNKKIERDLDNKYGNRKKHRTIYYHLEKFNGNKNLNFKDIDRDFLIRFKNYLENNIKPNVKNSDKPSINTINGYLKVFRTFLSEQKSLGKQMVDLSVFKKIIPRKNPTPKDSLEIIDIWKLDNFHINDPKMRKLLFNSLNTFMFNFWSQGLRIGDCLKLKWGNIKGNLIKLNMGKTDRFLTIPLTYNNCFRLLWCIDSYSSLYNWEEKKFNFIVGDSNEKEIHNNNYKNYLIQTFPNFNEFVFNNLVIYYDKIEEWKTKTLPYNIDFYLKDSNIHIRETRFSKSYNDFMKGYNEELKNLYIELIVKKHILYESVYHHIIDYSSKKEFNNQYIFPFLKDKIYEPNSDKLNNKIGSSTSLINKSLKEIRVILDIKKIITNHISRHSITSISKSLGVDIYDLKNMLGHTSIKQTENYINSLSTITSIQNTININNLLDN
jgi:integrase